jgi:Short C-terminal domain/Bacterial PH domain
MTIAQNLIADEQVVFESKKHWLAPVRDSVGPVLMILGAGGLRWISPNGDGLFGWIGGLLDLIAVVLLLGGIGWIVYNVVAWRTARFAVTNLRVMREEGLFKHRSSATLLTSLSDVKTSQGLGGRQLGYGDIAIYSQSGDAGVDRFRTITEPMAFRNAIMTQKTSGQTAAVPVTPAAVAEAASPATPAPAPQAVPSSSADAAEALSRLADLHDRGAITTEEFEAKKTEILARM